VRPDERILDELCERIVRGGVDAHDLAVSVRHGEVRLEGSLATARERSFVMDLVERVLGVTAIDADIVVRERAEAEAEVEPETLH
jgi:osmotically-inducible protein OsmY